MYRNTQHYFSIKYQILKITLKENWGGAMVTLPPSIVWDPDKWLCHILSMLS